MIDKKTFNRDKFEASFVVSLDTLKQSEAVTRRELRDLSRSVLDVHHATEDVGFINRLLNVLTPINRRSAIEYFKKFSGFHFDDKANMFSKKNKQKYADCLALTVTFLEDPSNNIWTWAERELNVSTEPKPYDLEAVTKYVEGTLKKADKAGFKPADVMRAILKGGMTVDAILAVMDELGYDAVVE